jgi:diaminopimelate decarboxylase
MRRAQTPGFDDYAKAVCDVLTSNSWISRRRPYLVLEPGVAMVANTVSFVTKVVSVKNIRGNLFVVVDGSAFHTKPTFHKINQPHSVISKAKREKRGTYSVVGATCMEKDYLLNDVENIVPDGGDYIKIDNVGAYTIVLSPPFIHPAPAIVAAEDNAFELIRSRQTPDEMFKNYIF